MKHKSVLKAISIIIIIAILVKVLVFWRLESARDGYIREFVSRQDHMQRSEYDLPYYKIFPKYLAAVPPGFIIGNVALLFITRILSLAT